MFVGQSGLMNFTISVNGDKCKAPEKRVSLQLEDKSVFSAVVEIENNEVAFNKVIQLTLVNDKNGFRMIPCYRSQSYEKQLLIMNTLKVRISTIANSFFPATYRPIIWVLLQSHTLNFDEDNESLT